MSIDKIIIGRNENHMDESIVVLDKNIILIDSLLREIDKLDYYTSSHSMRVANLSICIGKAMNLSEKDLKILELSSYIHDIGKIRIPREILRKPGKLTIDEYEIVKRHTIESWNIIKSFCNDFSLLLPILNHHEKLNGSGYPRGLAGEQINLVTRILTVADIFDALNSDRVYRRKLDLKSIKKILTKEVSDNLLDGLVVTTLLDLIENLGDIDDLSLSLIREVG